MPGWANSKWIDSFFGRHPRRSPPPPAQSSRGGDLSHGEKFACDVTVFAEAVPRGTAFAARRCPPRPKAGIYVSGALGGSALGLETQKGKSPPSGISNPNRASLPLASYLREKLRATSAIDLSDGLSLDLRQPPLPRLRRRCRNHCRLPNSQAQASTNRSHGGEEYELLFTLREGTRVPPAFEDLSLTRIGTILKGAKGGPGEVLLDGQPLAPLGYDHFAMTTSLAKLV